MRSKHLYIQILIALVSALITTNQAVWITNMYYLHEKELKDYANLSATKAIFMEVTERGEALGGVKVFSTNLSEPNDTSRYIVKRVRTEDTTYVVTIDKQDPNYIYKIMQLVLKDEMPVDLRKLNIFFKKQLSERYATKNTYFDYLDLKAHKVIKSNKPKNASSSYLQTDTIVLDILNNIGVVGHLKAPGVVILNQMGYQLTLSALLILLGIGGMIYLGRSFILQWKVEKLRQESINSMTHEFKRPISSAVAMVALIPFYIRKKNTDKVITYAENTITELNKLTAYTERIQQISNNEQVNIALNKERIEIVPLLQSILDRYCDTESNTKKVNIRTRVHSKQKFLFVDSLHFSNVMDNLVENAIKYSNTEVNIHIEVSDFNDKIKISVQDDGLGISTYDLKYIFDRFYRSNRKELKRKTGFGLGLTYVKSIVEVHGGSISVTSKINEGSEFTIFLNAQYEEQDTVG
jgi:two-component system, OmpR family, phosphate regulon sensor histidine kinase PhoR